MVYTDKHARGDRMNKTYLHRQFWKYVLPSMFAMLLSGFYAIVDGLFVGNAIGNTALAAINIAYPIQVVLNASAIGIGIGGAVVMSSAKGKHDLLGTNKAMGSSIGMLLIAGCILPIVLIVFMNPLLSMLGASGDLYKEAHSYILVILMGGILTVLGNGLNPLIRNHGKTILATVIMSSGLVTNIILDFILVFQLHMGLGGAALATIIAQGIVAVLSLIFLWKSDSCKLTLKSLLPDRAVSKQILRIALSPFGQTMAPSLVIIITNWMCLRYGGDGAVTIYSVISYVLASAQLLLQGIGDGVQPLISFYYGANKEHEIHVLYKKAFLMTLVTSILLCTAVFLFQEPLTALFGISDSLFADTRQALLITALSFPCLGITRLTSAIFYATEKTKNSTLLVYIEPCLLLPIALLIFSYLFQTTGIWIAYPVAQVVLCGMALWMKHPHKQPYMATCKELSEI